MNLEKRFELGICDIRIDPLLEYKKYIHSFFVGVPLFSEARSMYILLDYFGEFLKKCEDIPVWITVNSPEAYDSNIEKSIQNLISFKNLYPFKGYIIADTAVAIAMKNHNIPVRISTVCDVRSVREVSWYYEQGFSELVLSYKVNRNLDLIKECVKEFPMMQFTLVMNELCQSDCPYRMFHFIAASKAKPQIFPCQINTLSGSKLWYLKVLQNSIIPPENLSEYPDSIVFKLATRRVSDNVFSIEKALDILKIYSGEKKHTNLLDLISHHINVSKLPPIKPDSKLFKSWLNCKHQCHKCNLCKNYLEEMFNES